MPSPTPKTVCHTPTPGKQPTAIPTWKYELIKRAIQDVVPFEAPGIQAKDLPNKIRGAVEAEAGDNLGSIGWHTTTVRLNMEVEGELERIVGSKPIALIQCRR